MIVKDDQDRQGLRKIGRIVGEVLGQMIEATKAGMTTLEIDTLGSELLAKQGAVSAPISLYKFPGATCISVAPAVAHGIPDERVLAAGDLINIDVSAVLDGYFGDCGASFVVAGSESALAKKRAEHVRQGHAIFKAIVGAARDGLSFCELGEIMQKTAAAQGYTLIRNLCSHGVGRHLHEDPRFILPFPDYEDKRVLEKDLVITLEPFISRGSQEIVQSTDGWTLIPRPEVDTVQFEHSMIIGEKGVEILTGPWEEAWGRV